MQGTPDEHRAVVQGSNALFGTYTVNEADMSLVFRVEFSIAFEAGFGDLSYFNRSFRRRYAACPSDVRKVALRGQLRFNEPASSFLDKSEFAPVQDGHPERPTMCGASP
jgi:hypothetical protein